MSSRMPGRAMNSYRVLYNTGSTSLCISSTGSSTDNQPPIVVQPVGLTDRKFAHELYDRRPYRSNYSCVNKTTTRQVPLPRSNRTKLCVGGPVGRYGDTARQVLHRPWISADQSTSGLSSQAAKRHSSQSQLHLQTAILQSGASNPGSFRYKSRCRPQFVSSVVSNSAPAARDLVINWISSILRQSNTPVRHSRHPSARELPVEHSSVMSGYEGGTSVEHSSSAPGRTSIEHSSSLPSESAVEYSSSTSAEQSGSTPESDTESTVEHSSSTPIKFAKLDLGVLALVLMEHLSTTKTTDKATQVPEEQLHRCFICGHEAMALVSHRQHMLSLHGMDVVGVAVVYDDNFDASP